MMGWATGTVPVARGELSAPVSEQYRTVPYGSQRLVRNQTVLVLWSFGPTPSDEDFRTFGLPDAEMDGFLRLRRARHPSSVE